MSYEEKVKIYETLIYEGWGIEYAKAKAKLKYGPDSILAKKDERILKANEFRKSNINNFGFSNIKYQLQSQQQTRST